MLQPHELRVVEERRELAEKCDKLCAFNLTQMYDDLQPETRQLLADQLTHMSRYLKVLDARIAQFETQPDWKDHVPEDQRGGLIAEYDDGSAILHSSSTGGAHPAGAWGEVTLMEIKADGTVTFWDYLRTRKRAELSEARPADADL